LPGVYIYSVEIGGSLNYDEMEVKHSQHKHNKATNKHKQTNQQT